MEHKTEIVEEVLEEVLLVKHVLGPLRQLVEIREFYWIIDRLVLIIFPPIFEVYFNFTLRILIHIDAIVVPFLDGVKKHVQLFAVFNFLI